ncbi:uncharacterized protein LOC129005209 [Macrosteles quadrilineatus]|uniref:uncharacterized protein LOC129005209 n=1 Tax=Macrosteles quadrilineatus TaxID=74068 RepID=UPI0023E1D01A|nr:uncharacterized protein LOC129005209 [Macrosteles quadrilineatus]
MRWWMVVILVLTFPTFLQAKLSTKTAKGLCMAEGCSVNSTCMESCISSKLKLITNKGELVKRKRRGSNNLELLCHGTDRIAFKWCETPELEYIVQYSLVKDTSWTSTDRMDKCSFLLDGLKSNSEYRITLKIILDHHTEEEISHQFRTLPEGVVLTPVDVVQLQDVWADSPASASAELSWSFAPGFPCHYGLVLWKTAAISHANMSQVKYPEPLDHILVSNLELGTSYKFGVRALPGPDLEQESEVTWLYFDVPPCLYFNPGNLTVCSECQLD